MKKNKVYRLDGYAFQPQETLLLDANVWLFLFPAPSGTGPVWAKKYSAAFKQMLVAKTRLVMDALVLSEYVNRYCRIEWQVNHQATYSDFKRFRNSAKFPLVANGVALYVRRILSHAVRSDHPFRSINVEQVLADFEAGGLDLNDGLLTETCKHHGWKFVTNDGDFVYGGIDVLTNNPKLINACT